MASRMVRGCAASSEGVVVVVGVLDLVVAPRAHEAADFLLDADLAAHPRVCEGGVDGEALARIDDEETADESLTRVTKGR